MRLSQPRSARSTAHRLTAGLRGMLDMGCLRVILKVWLIHPGYRTGSAAVVQEQPAHVCPCTRQQYQARQMLACHRKSRIVLGALHHGLLHI